jgi:sugar lactone lactonase YvrE
MVTPARSVAATIAGAVAATSMAIVTVGAAFAAPPSGPPAPVSAFGNESTCPLERIGHQLVRCDVPTGAGVAAPMAVPVQHPRTVRRELTTFAGPDCTGGCGSGSTIGPDRALYVTDGKRGRVVRIDPRTGAQQTVAHGLPRSIDSVGIGGAIDTAFIGRTAYVLVTLVGPELGQPGVVSGIYRVGHDGAATPIADLGAWSAAHPPSGDYAVASGVQYAIQPFRGGFLVSDGHHNRVLRVELDGTVSELIALDNTVPTGLAVRNRIVYLGEAGPVPHLPETGRVVSFTAHAHNARLVASGARMIVDVEFGARGQLYVLSQGVWNLPDRPDNAGLPAAPRTGKLLRLDRSGSFTPIADGLDRPTSVELIGDSALVVTLTGKVIRIDRIGN